jgi:orotate phosphoribosyltransferase
LTNQSDLSKDDLRKALVDVAELKGEFTLRSGGTSDTYFDKYRFEADPNLLRQVAIQMAGHIPDGTEVIAGIEMGGIPLATALSLHTGIPAAFIRKQAKTYGTCNLAEGAPVRGKQVFVVEDIVSTGGQVFESVKELRARGAIITDALCVFLRNEKAEQAFARHDLKLRHLYRQYS